MQDLKVIDNSKENFDNKVEIDMQKILNSTDWISFWTEVNQASRVEIEKYERAAKTSNFGRY